MTDIKKIDIESEEYKKLLNDYSTYVSTFASGFVSNLFSQGIISEVDAKQLKEYFSDPDEFQEEIEDLAQYFYISTAEIHQLFELIEALPTLNYKIDSFTKSKSSDKHISLLNKALHKVKHKRLTRDLLKQTAAAGTLVGIWLGDDKSPYPFVFDSVKYVFPAFRRNGDWVCLIDLEYFSNIKEDYRKELLNSFSPFIKNSDYENFLQDREKYRYKELPQERTFPLRTGTLKRNQGLGTSWVTPGLYDVLHKKKLKDVERAIANKIINAVAVLTIGTDKGKGEYTNLKLPKAVKQKVHSGVKTALEKNNKDGVTVVSIPDFASLAFPDVKADGLDGAKFDHINSDIQSAYGLSGSLLNGEGGNYATSSLNLDTFYKRIGVLMEEVEQEVYQKLFNLILPAGQKDNYYMNYDKDKPLTLKEKMDILIKLNDKGWSIKHVIDNIAGVSWESYLEQTLYETDDLNLQDKIKPYQTSYTYTGNAAGHPVVDESTNENTIKSATSNGNSLPD
ncbi:hypothetical protein EI976_04965 [Bacillus licheniformis]|uniref:hypothetical protein n=1 Tax=Bacillus licheniformis TaxID=1402 RepID=UPI0002F0753F|nr:hypothetical protein [Bacillus licheniformis]KAA0813149.1 hypothetical protein EI978_08345 [Bacillus licheniformis]KAA0821338.1 hypothetical protein EI973_19355 [Bacillus licheniformis]KAA0826402.1 hypothetical protein EI976_04965 [Bacillus licheniformis]MBU8781503.1 hypothetical protein [Bacillus licheniformis]MBU8799552.1 hypothetical protein [Bacillus licheniformis]